MKCNKSDILFMRFRSLFHLWRNFIFFFLDPAYPKLWFRKKIFLLLGDVTADMILIGYLKWLPFELVAPLLNVSDKVRSNKPAYFYWRFGTGMHSNDPLLDNDWASSFPRHGQKPIVDLELFRKLNNRIFSCISILHKLDCTAIQDMMIALMCRKTK